MSFRVGVVGVNNHPRPERCRGRPLAVTRSRRVLPENVLPLQPVNLSSRSAKLPLPNLPGDGDRSDSTPSVSRVTPKPKPKQPSKGKQKKAKRLQVDE